MRAIVWQHNELPGVRLNTQGFTNSFFVSHIYFIFFTNSLPPKYNRLLRGNTHTAQNILHTEHFQFTKKVNYNLTLIKKNVTIAVTFFFLCET